MNARSIRTHNDGFDIWADASKKGLMGTSLMGYIDISYAELVKTFGNPNAGCDKSDAEWAITDGTRVATIYNYKDGKNYMGKSGTATSKIRDWHIGGHDQSGAEMLKELFPNHSVKIGW